LFCKLSKNDKIKIGNLTVKIVNSSVIAEKGVYILFIFGVYNYYPLTIIEKAHQSQGQGRNRPYSAL